MKFINKTVIVCFVILGLFCLVFFGCVKQNSPGSPGEASTATPVNNFTKTITPTSSISPTFSITKTITVTPTITLTSTITDTFTQTPTSTVTPTFTATSTALTIGASIDGFDTGSGWDITYDVSVNDAGGNAITNAAVTVKNITHPWQYTVTYNPSTSTYNIEDTAGTTLQYTSGDVYEIDVYANGVNYTAQAAAPGNGSLSADCNTVSWQYDGNNDSLEVDNPSSAAVLARSDPGLDFNTDISSVYTDTGDYSIYLWLVNSYNGVYAGSSAASYIWVEYDVGWDVTN